MGSPTSISNYHNLGSPTPDVFSTPSESLCDNSYSNGDTFRNIELVDDPTPKNREFDPIRRPSYLRYSNLENARGINALKQLSFKASKDISITIPQKSEDSGGSPEDSRHVFDSIKVPNFSFTKSNVTSPARQVNSVQ